MLNMEKEEYIVFADPVVEQICATNWGDGVGITPSQAKRVTNLGGVFQNNTQIVSFDELEYFTGLTILNYYANTAYGTFRNCTNLKSVVLPSSVKTLYSTFTGCSNLESVGSLENVETLSNNAFYGCSKLAINVYMPKLNSISSTAFMHSGITKISSLGNLTSIPSAGGNNGVFRNCKHLTEVVLPSSLTSIGNYAFCGCSNLSSISLPSSLTSIGTYCFYDCSSITTLSLPPLISSIGNYAFNSCTSLATVYYSGTGTFTIGERTFQRCPLTAFPTIAVSSMTGDYSIQGNKLSEMVFSSDISSFGYGACIRSGKEDTTVIMLASTPPTSAERVFWYDSGGGSFYLNTLLKIYVPYSSDHSILNAYKAASGWSDYADYTYELDANGNIPT